VGQPHDHRPEHNLPNTGEYLDGFGHPTYVYAVGNPQGSHDNDRYKMAELRASGFGLVRLDPEQRTYACEAYRFLCDVKDGNKNNQFPGWPLTIKQMDNYGRARRGLLPRCTAPEGVINPVVRVRTESTGELVYAIRAHGNDFVPFVFDDTPHTVEIGDPETDRWNVVKGLRIEQGLIPAPATRGA